MTEKINITQGRKVNPYTTTGNVYPMLSNTNLRKENRFSKRVKNERGPSFKKQNTLKLAPTIEKGNNSSSVRKIKGQNL
jgi:hypothetical protein